ncbi:MAG: tRNA pseudouridine(38-40) synthase TruA [Dehalococcoidia bacterium]
MPRFAATVSYDGEAFVGSQRQSNGRTVQGEIERALETIAGQFVRVDMAGRTDSGVHAIGQVAAFTAETRLDATTMGRALNARLPVDVAVRDVRPVAEDFDPRRRARRRSYRYTIWNASGRAPLLRRTAWHFGGNLDVSAMQQAARALEGQQDFMSCSSPLEPGRTSVRTVFRTAWYREGDTLRFDIEANAFLPQMVRRITGALVSVGRGAISVEEFAATLARAVPGSMGPTAPAHGLCLMNVYYDEGYSP